MDRGVGSRSLVGAVCNHEALRGDQDIPQGKRDTSQEKKIELEWKKKRKLMLAFPAYEGFEAQALTAGSAHSRIGAMGLFFCEPDRDWRLKGIIHMVRTVSVVTWDKSESTLSLPKEYKD